MTTNLITVTEQAGFRLMDGGDITTLVSQINNVFNGVSAPTFNSGTSTLFGQSGAGFYEEGNLYRVFSAGTSPASTGGDIVVAAFTIPANAFDVAGRSLSFFASGNFANNTNTKTAKIIIGATTATVGSAVVGGTTIATTGAYSTTGACGWSLQANLSKYGAAGSNTQMYQEMAVIINTTHGGMGVAATTTLTESSPIVCCVTLNSATTASDSSLWQFEINATN